MIYKFKSKAAGDVIMMGPTGDQVLRAVGREPAAKGIIEVAAMGPFAITYVNLWRSPDGGCSWTRATGSIGSLSVNDAFVDPNDASFVLAIATNASVTASAIYPSHDGGLTFGPPLYETSDRLVGIEFARSTRGVIYATQVHPATSAGGAYLLRSDDSGANWSKQALTVSSATEPRIAAVDPEDANKVYLRLLALGDPPGKDSIAITTDNGKTLNVVASLSTGTNFFTSFLRAKDGTLYAGTTSADLYVMPPGATSFTKRTGPRVGCLGQRPGELRIYACADAFVDGYSLGYSDDGAQTFQRLMTFTQIADQLHALEGRERDAGHLRRWDACSLPGRRQWRSAVQRIRLWESGQRRRRDAVAAHRVRPAPPHMLNSCVGG